MRLAEKTLQAHTVAALSAIGYACLETGVARRAVVCPKCGNKFTDHKTASQNAPGIPDLLVFRYAGWPSVFAGVEMKGHGTKITPRQQELADSGRTVLAYSVEDAIAAVQIAEEAMDGYRFATDRSTVIRHFLTMNEGRL